MQEENLDLVDRLERLENKDHVAPQEGQVCDPNNVIDIPFYEVLLLSLIIKRTSI